MCRLYRSLIILYTSRRSWKRTKNPTRTASRVGTKGFDVCTIPYIILYEYIHRATTTTTFVSIYMIYRPSSHRHRILRYTSYIIYTLLLHRRWPLKYRHGGRFFSSPHIYLVDRIIFSPKNTNSCSRYSYDTYIYIYI